MDKLSIINDALSATGNTRVNVLNSGTDEGIVAESAFDRAIRDLISRHRWPFATETANLVEVGTNPSKLFDNAWALLPAMFHVKRVFVAGYPREQYEIIGRTLCLDATEVSVQYTAMPASADWHPQAEEILTQMVEIGLLRGLNDDFDEADSRERRLELRLSEARSTIDMQNPARNIFQSSIADSRRRRRV